MKGVSAELFQLRFKEFIQANELFNRGEKLLLAMSGGIDSVVMADLFFSSNFDFGIAHCNFSLRGEESDDDEAFALSLASKYGKEFYSTRFDTERFAKENNYSIQQAARDLRYTWFRKLSDEYGYQKIVTAHHLDDSIETFFINLIRDSGPAGLRGIPLKNGNVIRPLMFTNRKEIEEYVKEKQLSFREDSSNSSDYYLRNRIRHHVIPLMKEKVDGFEERIKELMGNFSFVHDCVSNRMNEWKKANVRSDKEGNLRIPLDLILKEENREAFLSTLLYSTGITGIESGKMLSAETGSLFYSKDFVILRDREFLILRKKGEEEKNIFTVDTLPAEIQSGSMWVSIRCDDKISDVIDTSENVQQVSADDLLLPLILRPWIAGDEFQPLGMKTKKKVSDFYIDQKLNRFQKDKTLLLLSGTNIVCILGHRIDERYKITTNTKKILTIELSHL